MVDLARVRVKAVALLDLATPLRPLRARQLTADLGGVADDTDHLRVAGADHPGGETRVRLPPGEVGGRGGAQARRPGRGGGDADWPGRSGVAAGQDQQAHQQQRQPEASHATGAGGPNVTVITPPGSVEMPVISSCPATSAATAAGS